MQKIDSNVNFKDIFSHWLAYGMNLKISEDFIIEYIKNNRESLDLDNLLIASTFAGTDKIIKILVELGANLETKNINGSTPIMFIAEEDNLPMFEYFLEKGANMYTKNNYHHDVESYAFKATSTQQKVFNYIKTIQKKFSDDNITMETLKLKNKELNKELEDEINKLRQNMERLSTNMNDDRPEKEIRLKWKRK